MKYLLVETVIKVSNVVSKQRMYDKVETQLANLFGTSQQMSLSVNEITEEKIPTSMCGMCWGYNGRHYTDCLSVGDNWNKASEALAERERVQKEKDKKVH